MAFEAKNLSSLNYANGFTQWHYTTKDTLGDMLHEYFDKASEHLCEGDVILANYNTAVSPCICALHVMRNSDGTVFVHKIY